MASPKFPAVLSELVLALGDPVLHAGPDGPHHLGVLAAQLALLVHQAGDVVAHHLGAQRAHVPADGGTDAKQKKKKKKKKTHGTHHQDASTPAVSQHTATDRQTPPGRKFIFTDSYAPGRTARSREGKTRR
ncbi:hypothetical protein EYF80_054348 [Liparis tanakae]|uniref:Uncharacterized protein n=1 Tax=Liparis tanakae TaxID=230148 RepID=A0A4Z2F2W0_9TELE|nr:hypothetical protein EYF80_054348 [Liparis tanakae]